MVGDRISVVAQIFVREGSPFYSLIIVMGLSLTEIKWWRGSLQNISNTSFVRPFFFSLPLIHFDGCVFCFDCEPKSNKFFSLSQTFTNFFFSLSPILLPSYKFYVYWPKSRSLISGKSSKRNGNMFSECRETNFSLRESTLFTFMYFLKWSNYRSKRPSGRLLLQVRIRFYLETSPWVKWKIKRG